MSALQTSRAASKRWHQQHREATRRHQRDYAARNRTATKARDAAYHAAHPEQALAIRHRRRVRRARVLLVVRVEASACGVCLQPLTAERYPHPMATTIGHEPPLSVAEREGWTVVAERPEHHRCNKSKGAHTDAELVARWRQP